MLGYRFPVPVTAAKIRPHKDGPFAGERTHRYLHRRDGRLGLPPQERLCASRVRSGTQRKPGALTECDESFARYSSAISSMRQR